jgi:hypothetical protein
MTPAVKKTTQLNIRDFPADLLRVCKAEAVGVGWTLKKFVIESLRFVCRKRARARAIDKKRSRQ